MTSLNGPARVVEGEVDGHRLMKPLPHYEVNLAEMNRLVRAVVEKTSVNPRALMHRLLTGTEGRPLSRQPRGRILDLAIRDPSAH